MMECGCVVFHRLIERRALAIGRERATACPCECHAPCIICGAYGGEHDPGCMVAPCPTCGQKECSCTPAALTPGEVAELRKVRERALEDRGDVRPMLGVTYEPERVERVLPWLVALNLDPSAL